MANYEELTKYIAIFDENPIETVFSNEDVDEGILMYHYNKYSPQVDSFAQDVMKFVDEHPYMDLYHYTEIIDSFEDPSDTVKAPRLAKDAVSDEYLAKLDAKGVAAWIVSAVRAEHFQPGSLYETIRTGVMRKWLVRLSEL